MRGRRKSDLIAAAGVIIIMFFFIFRYYADVNIDPTVGETLFALLPGFIVLAACVFVTAETRGVGKLGGMIGIGISLCYLLYAADGEGLITVEMLSGLTVPQVQVWTIIISSIFGFIIYAAD